MNLQELRTLIAIVETGSLVRASQVLNVTQSTVTARLNSLEDEVGQTLINRKRSGATLTAAGVRLHRYADTISDLWHQARQETSLPDGMSGVCNLACESDLWPNLGERFFHQLQAQHPEIAISVWLGSQTDVAAWLNDGKSDIAFTYRSAVTQGQGQVDLAPDTLVLVSTDPAGSTRSDPGYVYVEAGEAFGRNHAVAYADTGTQRISFGNATTGLQHVLNVGGSAYLPLRLVQDALDKKLLFRLADVPEFKRSVFVIFNTDARDGWVWLDALLDAL
jgi:DNA-binding transcriptional LysR family regulator